MPEPKQQSELSLHDFFRQESEKKVTRYRHLNRFAKKGQTVFAGSSLMEQFPLNELLMDAGMDLIAYNRGIGGFTTAQYLEVLDACVLDLEPSRLLINIGSNDLDLTEKPLETLEENYRTILTRIREALPDCEIIMLAYYPVRREPGFTAPGKRPRTLETVAEGNAIAGRLAEEFGCQFLNVNHVLADDDGYLKPELASDGMHMWPSAYQLLLKELRPYLL